MAIGHEQRRNQIIGCECRFTHHTAQGWRAAQTPWAKNE
jgi:hypothetical protein